MKQKLQQLFNKNNPKQTFLNVAYTVFLVSLCFLFLRQFLKSYDLLSTCGKGTWNITEFLINYQGGFVRRGLIGEILFFFAKNFNINVEVTIKIICLICCFAVCIFFVRAFLKKGYTLYILPLYFFLGGIIISEIVLEKIT